MKKIVIITIVIICALASYSFSGKTKQSSQLSFQGPPTTREQLGEMLFFESALSVTRKLNCASCHIPSFAFADTIAFSKGIHNRLGKRNAPSCMNIADRPHLFYDGRATTLEDQVRFPIEDTNEMGLPIAEAVSRLRKNKDYIRYFRTLYNDLPTETNLKSAIAAFERTLETSNTPFDSYMDGDTTAISASAIRGRELFMGTKAKCFDCHFSPDFTGDEFRNIGLYDGVSYNDRGRFTISKDSADLGKFKVPGLRNVAITAPYMHNGIFKSLRQVIDYYDNPYNTVTHPINMDTLMLQPLHLTTQEKEDLENFLIALTDERFKQKP